jgi:hypothetical protein
LGKISLKLAFIFWTIFFKISGLFDLLFLAELEWVAEMNASLSEILPIPILPQQVKIV